MLKTAHEWYLSAESVSSFPEAKKTEGTLLLDDFVIIFLVLERDGCGRPKPSSSRETNSGAWKTCHAHHVSDVQHGRFLYPKLAEQKTCHVFTDGRNFCIRLVLLVYPIIYIGVFTLTSSPFVALQIRAKPLTTFQKIKAVGKKPSEAFGQKKPNLLALLTDLKKVDPTQKSHENHSKQTSPQHHLHQKFSPNFAGKFWPRDNGWIDWSRIGNVDRPCEDVPHWPHPGAQLKRLSSATLEAGNI